jgi:signal transduction histidine kinase
LDAFFERRSKTAILMISLVTAIIVGALAYFTTTDLLIIYLAPIFLASWYAGWRAGAVVATYAAVAAFVIETIALQAGDFQPRLLATLAVRLAAYLIIARTMAQLSETRRQQEELTNFIVHDLRSPLASSITGLMTLQQTGQVLPGHDRELVELALVSNNRALSLVNSMLDVAKLESGKMPVQHEEVDVRALVVECLKQMELWARSQSVEMVSEVQCEHAKLDPGLTSRIIVNLVSNALKFSPEGSTVIIRCAHSHGGVRFSVVDQGPGIPPEYVHAVFERFGQVKGTKGGTGLGLTFCRVAVQAQGGRIWVESHAGKGTTMHFTIPQHGHGQASPSPVRHAPQP